jgi:hypothetical protein
MAITSLAPSAGVIFPCIPPSLTEPNANNPIDKPAMAQNFKLILFIII